MAELLSTLSVVSIAIAGVCLVISVFLWFFFRIPSVIGDLSGRTARKSIAKMRSANEKSGLKTYKQSKVNAERGKLTDTIKRSDESSGAASVEERAPTGLLKENYADGEQLAQATGLLQSDDTSLLAEDQATAPLVKTTVQRPAKKEGKVPLKLLDEVMIVHTNETIC